MSSNPRRPKLVAAGERTEGPDHMGELDCAFSDARAAQEALDALLMAADEEIRGRDEALGTNLAETLPLNALAYLSLQIRDHLQAAGEAHSAALSERRHERV